MEIRVIGRGALAGFIAGVLGFVFAHILAEPFINKAIDYESGRDDILTALNQAAGRPVTPDGPEVFSRTIQSTIGMFSGIVAFSTAMGALVAVAYLVLHGRYTVRPQTLVWQIAAFGFLGVYGLIIGVLPSLGHLAANKAHAGQFGYNYAATETPQPITNILATPLTLDGKTFQPGQIVYPGFDADVLWKFRWYSIINQLLISTTIAMIFGALVDRFVVGRQNKDMTQSSDDPVAVA